MADQEPLKKISVAHQAAQLNRPFNMIDLVQIDDLALSLFLCQGTMPFHRHVDQDELFLVHSGTISLESEWGTAILRTGELAVTPKGLGHRSSSMLRSLVLLLRPREFVNRRNGDRRLFVLKSEGRLEKLSVPAMGRQLSVPFKPVTLAHLDTFAFNLVLVRQTGPWWQDGRQNSLIFCYDGQMVVESDVGAVSLSRGEMVVVPTGMPYRLVSAGRALVLTTQRHRQPGIGEPD